MDSIWSKTTEPQSREPLKADLETDTVVIGGGLAGVLIAYFLKQQGIDVCILEAERIGGGQTKNTTAKITSQHGLIYNKLIETLGEAYAKQYATANQQAIEAYETIIEQNQIDCEFKRLPAYLYSVKEDKPLKREAEAAQKLGIPAHFTSETSLPFPVKGSVCFAEQAQFHPLKFLYKIAEKLTIFEHTKVKTVEDHTVITEHGKVTAKHIVFATHYPFPNAPGYYFMRMHQERSYVLALKNAVMLDGMYLGVDQNNGWSLRNWDEYLLFGGGQHRTGENTSGGRYRLLREKAMELWPEATELACWSAQDCMTHDGVPYIGQFSETTPDWYVATGFQKWGMTTSMVAAMLLAEQISGGKHPCSDVFSPQRFTPGASAKEFMKDSVHTVKDLSRRFITPPRCEIDALPNGHGGVVECEGEKVGVYKDSKGTPYVVSIRCPHLGCQLEWNPDEKSWDCPCHGSRFDYEGHLIDNPAQEDLTND